jgi:hypothetical protein
MVFVGIKADVEELRGCSATSLSGPPTDCPRSKKVRSKKLPSKNGTLEPAVVAVQGS